MNDYKAIAQWFIDHKREPIAEVTDLGEINWARAVVEQAAEIERLKAELEYLRDKTPGGLALTAYSAKMQAESAQALVDTLEKDNARLTAEMAEAREALKRVSDIYEIWECEGTMTDAEYEVAQIARKALAAPEGK